MDEKKVQEIFSDEAFVTSLLAMDTPEEVQAALKGKGLEFSLDQIEAFKKQISAQSGEMADEDLDNVAGGFKIPILPGLPVILPFQPLPFLPKPRW